MAPLTPADVKRWDADAIHGVFQTATNRAATLQTLGDNLQQVHSKLSDWQGEAGDAFRADLNKTRRDIEADGHESKQVAAAVARAEADVRAVKAELGGIEQSAEGLRLHHHAGLANRLRHDEARRREGSLQRTTAGAARYLQIACSQRRPGTRHRCAQRRRRHSFSCRCAAAEAFAGQSFTGWPWRGRPGERPAGARRSPAPAKPRRWRT